MINPPENEFSPCTHSNIFLGVEIFFSNKLHAFSQEKEQTRCVSDRRYDYGLTSNLFLLMIMD